VDVQYDVPRALDVPDRVGVPGFTTAQFFVLLAGIALAILAFRAPPALLPPWLAPWLVVWLPVVALLAPRPVGASGWTAYRLVVARVGRWLRPRRVLWKPE
jgi:hypothetical protein